MPGTREILRRISIVDDGQAKLLDREEFRRRMRVRFGAGWCGLYGFSKRLPKKRPLQPIGMTGNGLDSAQNSLLQLKLPLI
jgi:hypothetical protein